MLGAAILLANSINFPRHGWRGKFSKHRVLNSLCKYNEPFLHAQMLDKNILATHCQNACFFCQYYFFHSEITFPNSIFLHGDFHIS